MSTMDSLFLMKFLQVGSPATGTMDNINAPRNHAVLKKQLGCIIINRRRNTQIDILNKIWTNINKTKYIL